MLVSTFRPPLIEWVDTTYQAKLSDRILKIALFGSHAKDTWVNDSESWLRQRFRSPGIINHEKLMEGRNFFKISGRVGFCSMTVIINPWLGKQVKQL
ncbi:MAG: hypothetical protein P8179_11990 [Candidatus Thiodiazotropha sp.]